MQKLPDNDRYYYKGENNFKSKIDNIRTFVKKNYEIGMHIQDFFEINIVTSGKGKHYIEDNCIDAEKGDVFIIPPMVRHGYIGGENFDVAHVLVSDRFIEKNMSELQLLPSFFILFTLEPMIRASASESLHLRLNGEQFEKLSEILEETFLYKDNSHPSSALVRNALGKMIITLLCRWYDLNEKESSGIKRDDALITVISMMHECYNEHFTIAELAKRACMSRSLFIRRFIEICKMAPMQYLTKIRLDVAENLLLNTVYTISEIASKTGFYDVSHFSRAFEQSRGISPSKFRKRKTINI